MRWSTLYTFWIGHGHLKYAPGSLMGRVGRPNVVTTATSVVRTWNMNSSVAKITTSNPPIAIVTELYFISSVFRCCRQRRAQQTRIQLFLKVQQVDILRIRPSQYDLARPCPAARKRVE